MELTLPELMCSACLNEYEPTTAVQLERALKSAWRAVTVTSGEALCGYHLIDAMTAHNADLVDHIDRIPDR